jgi:hypothetical protein
MLFHRHKDISTVPQPVVPNRLLVDLYILAAVQTDHGVAGRSRRIERADPLFDNTRVDVVGSHTWVEGDVQSHVRPRPGDRTDPRRLFRVLAHSHKEQGGVQDEDSIPGVLHEDRIHSRKVPTRALNVPEVAHENRPERNDLEAVRKELGLQ